MRVGAETSQLTLRLPARPEYLMFSRLVLTGLSRAIEVDAETLADLKLAVSEACSYAIRTGGEGSGTLSIRYELRDGEVAVEVEAELAARSAPPDEDNLGEGDLGLAIITALVEELEVEHGPEGQVSRVSFRKTL
jgi:anti-sigma regulatory factor (Ser/Thr protein kinase)